MSGSELIAVERFFTRLDAELAHAALTAAGIDSIVSPDDAGGAYAGVKSMGVRLLVRAEDVKQAQDVLSQAPELDPEE
jgi:predicted Fe-Mo cluster-binding NifX family protein